MSCAGHRNWMDWVGTVSMQPQIGLLPDLSRPARVRWAEAKVGLRSFPYLAEHGFQDVIVLPGSACIQMALLTHQEIFKNRAAALRNIKFQNPVLLTDDDTLIKIRIEEKDGNLVDYAFLQADSGNGASASQIDSFARLEIIRSSGVAENAPPHQFSIEEFKRRGASLISGEEFYRTLRQNNNQYGPRFRKISEIWRRGDEALATVSAGTSELETQPSLELTVLDSIIQVLAVFSFENGRPFALTAIDRLEVHQATFTRNLWVHARRCVADGKENRLIGDIDVFDESGCVYLTLRGVALTHLDRNDGAALKTADQLRFCVASTFTAEPLEESLKFWGSVFNIPIDVQFAGHGQVFQQLLDGESSFRKNNGGVNVLLIALEDWVRENRQGHSRQAALKLDYQRAAKHFNGTPSYRLPNGLQIVDLNRHETDYLYQEIFYDRCYLQHGIQLSDEDTVIDIGANIGLFSLFVLSQCRNPTIYAFEPSPVVYELLQRNCAAYGTNVRAFQLGVSRESHDAEFTFYANSSVFSTFHPDPEEDRKAIDAIAQNTLRREIGAATGAIAAYAEELTRDRLRSETSQCRVVSLSDIIRKNKIAKVDLLKIDAERSELDILEGIEDRHWPLISQIVIEVHDGTRQRVAQIERLLVEKGYHCVVEQEQLLEKSGLFNVYASRRGQTGTQSPLSQPASLSAHSLEKNVDELCAAVTSFMTHSASPLVVCLCPHEKESANYTFLNEAERMLLEGIGRIPDVHAVSLRSIQGAYCLNGCYDAHSYALAGIPYNTEGYAAIATALFQTLIHSESSPTKVVVLDCDDTLWEGACGEDGPCGVRMHEVHRMLQEFAVKQAAAGLLICLCSKNNEKDVFDIFDRQKDMVLKREHLTSWQINWNRKSLGIKALAEELKLDLQSFVFIDNDPVECAEVRINCPEVLTLQLPREREMLRSFLHALWCLNRTSVTNEGRNRTKLYRDDLQRRRFREQTFSLGDFLKGLELCMNVSKPRDEQFSRLSELTYRTNQFNFTTIRRSEAEIRTWLEDENHGCLIANVRDRFGDYGLVGLLLYETNGEHFTLDTFLLSCRALGRGVEHYMLSQLARKAQTEGRRFIELQYLPTKRNAPVFEFLNSLDADLIKDRSTPVTFKFSVERLATLAYEPDCRPERPVSQPGKAAVLAADGRRSRWFEAIGRSEAFQRIATELYDIRKVATAIEEHVNKLSGERVKVESDDTLETALTKLWKRVLGKPEIGINHNFFDLGGTSLKAVQVVALIQKELGSTLSVTNLFECPTIRLLAKKLNGVVAPVTGRTEANAAQIRGQRRRYAAERTRIA